MFRLLVPKIFITVLVLALVGGAGFAGGIIFDQQALQYHARQASAPDATAVNMDLISQAWNIIQKNYVDRPALKDTTLTYGAISGMVDALGDTGHSRFLSPESVRSNQVLENGKFEGIGAEVAPKDGNVVIVAPIPGSPAEKAGVQAGDIILKVDGVDVTGQAVDAVVQRIIGPAGTKVTIDLENPTTKQVRSLTITRAVINVVDVSWAMVPGTSIADIQLAAFSRGVTDQLKTALKAAQAAGAKGVIFDLRNDPGGLLDEAIGVSSQFLKSGAVLEEKNAQGVVKPVAVLGNGVAYDIPLVVLINQGTASAAEIVSGALQDAQRAPLIGSKTFGTGTVLNEFPLQDHSALLLATEEWLTPKGRTIWHQGITPDNSVDLAANAQPMLVGALKNASAADVQATQDAQFAEALKVLNGKINP